MTLFYSKPAKMIIGIILATLFYSTNPLAISELANRTLFVAINDIMVDYRGATYACRGHSTIDFISIIENFKDRKSV